MYDLIYTCNHPFVSTYDLVFPHSYLYVSCGDQVKLVIFCILFFLLVLFAGIVYRLLNKLVASFFSLFA